MHGEGQGRDLRGARALVLTAVLGLAPAGCGDVHAVAVDPLSQSGLFVEIDVRRPIRVDLLFVVDDSSSMVEEQEVLASDAAGLIRDLVAPERDPDGPPRVGIEDLHVGITTTDLGGCGAGDGDGGRLVEGGADCAAQPRPWLARSQEAPDDGSDEADPPIWEDFDCLASSVGTSGCEVEQPLEAALLALTVQTRPGGPNEGFLRPDSFIAIVFVTDEDDCSVEDLSLFDPRRDDLGPPATRCARHEELLYPVRRYYDAFLALRPDAAGLVSVSAIVGVPTDGSWSPGDPIDQLRALRRTDPEDPDALVPSCETDVAVAYPPPRIAELVYMFGYRGWLASICLRDWSLALRETASLTYRDEEPCMTRRLPSADASACRVVETLPDDAHCPHPAHRTDAGVTEGWHVDLGLDEHGRRECEVLPADFDGDGCPDGPCDCAAEVYDGCLQGWFYQYDEGACGSGRIRLSTGELPAARSGLWLVCRTSFCPVRRQCIGAADAATACDPARSGGCPSGQVCVRHHEEALCHGEASCGRCSPTVEASCWTADLPRRWAEEPLVRAGACCHEGFHCDPAAAACIADRWLACE